MSDPTLDLARQHHQAGRLAEAESLYRQVLSRQPGDAAACFFLANVLRDAGRLDEAIEAYQRALTLQRDFAAAHVNLGTVWAMRHQWDQAIAAYRAALALQPNVVEIHYNLATALHCDGQRQEATAVCQRALALRPQDAGGWCQLGNLYAEQGRTQDALDTFERALTLQGDSALAHMNLGSVLLRRGDFARGWPEFEWRLRLPHLHLARNFPQPQWKGEPLHGQTILLHAEGGFGDAIQFARFVPDVAKRGGTVLLECQPTLVSLLQQVPGISGVFGRGQALPPFDWQAPLVSLPLALGTTLETIPAQVPYLSPPPQLIPRWKEKLAADASLKIGLVWAGSDDAFRSNRLGVFAPLAAVARHGGVRFFSLQKGAAAEQALRPPPGLALFDWTEQLHDWADTAALIHHLDLVIAVDTAPVHLAGAMAKNVWVLLPTFADFRWLLERSDSPWYPTMRLFRQVREGDWTEPIQQMVQALSAL